jgi:glycosidase
MNQLLHALILSLLLTGPQQSESARPTPTWVRDGVVYEIFPRAFSPEGNLNGITARLDDLKDLGVTILWLMPIHPIGQEQKNHDERRAIAHFGEQAALAASAFVFTMDGVPLLYNGMEVGDTAESGAPALFERIPIFWHIRERRPQFEHFYKQIIALRRGHPALSRGEIEWLHNGDERRVVTFLRRGGNEELLVAINFSNLAFSGAVEVKDAGSFADITPRAQVASSAAAGVRLPSVTLAPWGYRIFHRTTG